MFDLCNFQGLQLMLCAHMAALTETCQDAGYVVKPWRGPQFCRESLPGQGPFLQDADASGGLASRNASTSLGVPSWTPSLAHQDRESCCQK